MDSELQVIAERTWRKFVTRTATVIWDPIQVEDLEEYTYYELDKGWNPVKLIGRARNPQQLGDLDVVHMDFEFSRGKQTKLLIPHVAKGPGESVSDIIQKEFAQVDLVMLLEPLLEGEVLVVCAPCYLKPLKEANMAGAHGDLEKGHSHEAFQIADAAINSCRGSLEAFHVKGQAAAILQLYDVAAEAYRAALTAVTGGSGEHQIILERIRNAEERQEQAKCGPVHGKVAAADYISDRLEIRSISRKAEEARISNGVFAKEPVAAGEVLVVSNGVEEGSNPFAMVLDACGRSSRLRKQIELLWQYKFHKTANEKNALPDYDLVSRFRPPEAFEGDSVLVDIPIVWCAVENARTKVLPGSSLWPFACFFDEVEGDNHNLEVQVNGRTLVLRARRDIEAGEMLTVPAREDVVGTRFWYEDGVLVREKLHSRGDPAEYEAWLLRGERPPEDTDWSSFVEGPVDYYRCDVYSKSDLDTSTSDEIVAELFADLQLHWEEHLQ